jgi:hypothetical protein
MPNKRPGPSSAPSPPGGQCDAAVDRPPPASGEAMSGVSGGDAPDAVLAELGRAISRAADALAEVSPDDNAAAHRCAKALDAAFGDLTELLRAMPWIVGIGAPGHVVSQSLEHSRAELAARRSEVAAYRRNLEELEASQQSLAELRAESGSLRDRIRDLASRNEVVSADLAQHEVEVAQLAAEHQERLSVLAAWSQADADVANGLRAAGFGASGSALEIVTAELNDVRQRLATLDDTLGQLLADHALAYEETRQTRGV